MVARSIANIYTNIHKPTDYTNQCDSLAWLNRHAHVFENGDSWPTWVAELYLMQLYSSFC